MPVEALIIQELIIPLAGMATGILLGLPVIKAVIRHFERKAERGLSAADPALKAELDELRERVESSDDARERLAELEERLDFAERVLAQQREAGRIGPGHS